MSFQNSEFGSANDTKKPYTNVLLKYISHVHSSLKVKTKMISYDGNKKELLNLT